LGEIGYKIVIYPVTAILAAAGAVRRAFRQIDRAGLADIQSPESFSLKEYHELLSFYEYQNIEERHRIDT
jgi:2-methylisocitrate lyase-like PEP mutase family enzyme